MKSIAIVLGISCLLSIALTINAGEEAGGESGGGVSVNAEVKVPKVQVGLDVGLEGVLGGSGGLLGGLGVGLGGPSAGLLTGNSSVTGKLAAQVANQTAELIRHVVVVIGIITEGLQIVFDGICALLFKLYSGFVYPVLDCLTGILGIQDAICAISDSDCIRQILEEISSAGNRTGDDLAGLVTGGHHHESRRSGEEKQEGGESPQPGKRGAPVPAGGSHREEGQQATTPRPTEHSSEVNQSDIVQAYLNKFPGGDRKYAVNTLKILTLIIEVTLYLSARVHLPAIVLCPAQRKQFGFDQPGVACPFGGGAGGGSGGGSGGSSGLLGGLLGGGSGSGSGSGSGGLLGGLLGGR